MIHVFREEVQDSQEIIRLFYVHSNHYMPLIENDLLSSSTRQSNNAGRLSMLVEFDHCYAQRELTSSSISEQANNIMDFEVEPSLSIYTNNDTQVSTLESSPVGMRPFNEDSITTHSLGRMDSECDYCHALYFKSEMVVVKTRVAVFHKCCMEGKYVFDFNFSVPPLIQQLLCNSHPQSNDFVTNIRQYNSGLAFASFGATVGAGCVPGRGPYSFRVQGIIYHLSSNLRQDDNAQRKFAQLYFIDSSLANQCRSANNPQCSLELFIELDTLMRNVNNYARTFMNLQEVEEREMRRCHGNGNVSIDYSVWLLKKPTGNRIDRSRYSLPICNEIAAVFSTDNVNSIWTTVQMSYGIIFSIILYVFHVCWTY